ncbi:MAG: 16S rRNA (cytidine(1402)-2'-O)-methyltransferase [Odoribacteraceae bacterium]|jgi:16S rRNA (cytidine1402-2'-O)-methyltransferase|nr:16S rRNA (cytidine(1402)-2'-O)-methyltransferase [Odoribacteraceae bacterium]
MAKLFLIPTPVGNLEDITLRAIRVLKEVSVILAEDTRVSAVLLKRHGIATPLLSHHKFNEHQQVGRIADRIDRGEDVALISDAGTPGISDPGFLLVRACVERGIETECLPGATAFVPALVNSAFPCDRFCFEGFLPQKKGRQKRLLALAGEERTMIFYESPFRLLKALEQMSACFGGERRACVAREISKIHEEYRRGSLDELVAHFTSAGVKGEIVILVEGKSDTGSR